jgi:hypothetical protein
MQLHEADGVRQQAGIASSQNYDHRKQNSARWFHNNGSLAGGIVGDEA